MDTFEQDKLLKIAIEAVFRAGKKIVQIYQEANLVIEFKIDNSPLTLADKSAHEIITQILKPTEIHIISEEDEILDYPVRKNWELCWIVDPLDGTKEFIKRNGEFTVNIALIQKGNPILGVIYAPVLNLLYFSNKDKAFKYTIKKQTDDFEKFWNEIKYHKEQIPLKNKTKPFTVIASKSHQNSETKRYIEKLKTEYQNIEILSVGSSLKFCMIAEGKADLYPRFSNIMEWDIAAGHAIINAAGGKVIYTETGLSLTYNKENLTNPWFIASL